MFKKNCVENSKANMMSSFSRELPSEPFIAGVLRKCSRKICVENSASNFSLPAVSESAQETFTNLLFLMLPIPFQILHFLIVPVLSQKTIDPSKFVILLTKTAPRDLRGCAGRPCHLIRMIRELAARVLLDYLMGLASAWPELAEL